VNNKIFCQESLIELTGFLRCFKNKNDKKDDMPLPALCVACDLSQQQLLCKCTRAHIARKFQSRFSNPNTRKSTNQKKLTKKVLFWLLPQHLRKSLQSYVEG